MSRELTKMNLIAIVQQLPEDDIELIQTYISMIEEENNQLKDTIKELAKKIKVNERSRRKQQKALTDKSNIINELEKGKNKNNRFLY